LAVKEVNEKYRCNICGNELVITKAGGGTLVCCGEEMELLEGKKDEPEVEEGYEVDEEYRMKKKIDKISKELGEDEEEEEEPKEIEDYEEDMEE